MSKYFRVMQIPKLTNCSLFFLLGPFCSLSFFLSVFIRMVGHAHMGQDVGRFTPVWRVVGGSMGQGETRRSDTRPTPIHCHS